jgi:hypothetical protein
LSVRIEGRPGGGPSTGNTLGDPQTFIGIASKGQSTELPDLLSNPRNTLKVSQFILRCRVNPSRNMYQLWSTVNLQQPTQLLIGNLNESGVIHCHVLRVCVASQEDPKELVIGRRTTGKLDACTADGKDGVLLANGNHDPEGPDRAADLLATK